MNAKQRRTARRAEARSKPSKRTLFTESREAGPGKLYGGHELGVGDIIVVSDDKYRAWWWRAWVWIVRKVLRRSRYKLTRFTVTEVNSDSEATGEWG